MSLIERGVSDCNTAMARTILRMRVDEARLTATYMLANRKHGTLYVGSALDLVQRISEHKAGSGSRFAVKYAANRLVWFQPFMLVTEARDFEYKIKKWRREWKVNLIEIDNPDWDDLYPTLTGGQPIRSRRPPG